MIKKAVLPLLTAPFLMVFSDDSYSSDLVTFYLGSMGFSGGTPAAACSPAGRIIDVNFNRCRLVPDGSNSIGNVNIRIESCSSPSYYCQDRSEVWQRFQEDPLAMPRMQDEDCSSDNGDSFSTSDVGTYNYLSNGGSVRTHSGACTVTGGVGGVDGCAVDGDSVQCMVSIESSSTGEWGSLGQHITGGLDSDGTFSVIEFNTPDYLNELPGGCSDPSSCVTIGDTSYLVDWDSAPDYFSYVDSNGNTHSKPSSGGGGSGGDTGGGDNGGSDPTDPTNPTDPTDPGGDNGGDTGGGDDSDDDNDNGGGSGGGSTVPDFEFDESGIIEAIGSAGRSNRNAINALSNDVTGAISNQTNDLNAATNAQTDSLNNTLNSQTDTLTSSLENQSDSLTGAIDDQTGTLTSSLDALGSSIVDAINAFGSGETGDGEGEGEDGEGDGLLGGISKLLNGMVDNLASRFTEDLGDGNDLFDASGMDETLDGVATQEEQHSDEVNSLMDEIGDGATSGIADQVTSRLPSLPSGGCVPFQFGPMEISCRPFNLIKSWLTWAIYFYSVISIINTFFRSEQRTA